MRSMLALVWGRRVRGRGSAVVGFRGRGIVVCVRWRTIGDGCSRGYSTARCRLWWWWARGKWLLALTGTCRHLHVPYHLRDLVTFGLVWRGYTQQHLGATTRFTCSGSACLCHSTRLAIENPSKYCISGAINLRWQRIGIVALVVGHGRLALTQL